MLDCQNSHLNAAMLSVLRASNEMDSTLLITGGTGTGKSHLALAVHRANQKRSTGRWFKVNLATLSENLIESELFGHERGAFTGADGRRIGKLEAANGGTIFLDEIGELPLRLQAKLLDFIQYKKISPVGSNREIELDVRIIAATNRNLEAAVKASEFRLDLYHRLNVFHVRLPDLALNPRAVIEFARAFVSDRAEKAGKKISGFSKEVELALKRYPWPGNIRELENVIEFAVAMEPSSCIQMSSLPPNMQEYARENKISAAGSDEMAESASSSEAEKDSFAQLTKINGTNAIHYLQLPMTLDFHESRDHFEKAYLQQALKLCGGQINLTSRRIGLNKVSLTDKIRRFSIDWRKIRYETLGPALPASKEAVAAAIMEEATN